MNKLRLEKKVLSGMLHDEEFCAKATHLLNTHHFTNEIFKMVFTVVVTYFKSYHSLITKSILIDRITQDSKDLRKAKLYRRIIKKVYSKEVRNLELPYLLDEIQISLKGRQMLSAIDSTLDKIKDGKVEHAESHLRSALASIQQSKLDIIQREGEYLDGFEVRKKLVIDRKLHPEKFVGAFTGIQAFDEMFKGLLPEEFGLIAGGTGKGKSILLMNMGIAAYIRRWNVIIVTIEMPKIQYEYRLDSRFTGIMSRKFRTGELEDYELVKWERRIKKLRMKMKNQIYIIDVPKGCNADFIAYKISDLLKRYGERTLLLIDYMNLMHPINESRKWDDWKQQGVISHDIKELARDFHIPTWSVAQLEKKSVKREYLTPEDLGRSYMIPQNADFILGLVQTREDELENIVKLVNIKGREGKMPEQVLHPAYDFMSIR